MMHRRVHFKALKAQVSIRQVLDYYGLTAKLRRRGDALRGRCPIHKGSNATEFSVSLERNCFRCFSCQAEGNILDLVAGLEGARRPS